MSLVSLLAQPDRASDRLLALIAAWRALEEAGSSMGMIERGGEASDGGDHLRTQGLSVPHDLSVLYRHLGGGITVQDAMIELYGWPPRTLGAIGVWGMEGQAEPQQLRWIGGETGEELFGVWLPRLGEESAWAPAVVARQGTFYDQVVAAGGVVELLVEMTVINLQDDRPAGTAEALEALGVPAELRRGDPDDAAYRDRVAAWADPLLGARGYYVGLATQEMADIPATIEALSRSLGSR